MNGAEVGVLEEMDEKGLGGLLQRLDGLALPAQVADAAGPHRQRHLAHQPRERQLQQQ